jgi:hemolysin III
MIPALRKVYQAAVSLGGCDPPQSAGEEIANSVSHGASLIAALLAAPLLVMASVRNNIAGMTVFAGTMVLLYLSSTLYHACPECRAKRILRVLDHGSIYLFIAGTYTPFALGVFRGVWGWTLFGLEWGLALLGVMLKAGGCTRFPRLSMAIYMVMGWLVVIAFEPFSRHVPESGLLLLLAGGIAYTAGTLFYAAERVRYAHFIWHLFVVLGTACHYCAVLWYSM